MPASGHGRATSRITDSQARLAINLLDTLHQILDKAVILHTFKSLISRVPVG